MPKIVGGFCLTSLEDAMQTLVNKWIIQALLHGQSKLQTLLRHRIKQLQSS